LIENKQNINSLALAYLGDAIYEVYIRKYLLNQGVIKVKDLQRQAITYVSAKAQSSHLEKMINDNFLSEEEIRIVKRARNHKSHSSKSADILTYKKATGLEALIGYLDITNNKKRIEEIMRKITRGD
jgi:ribonuclease III family protein